MSIYMDHAATTPVHPDVLQQASHYFAGAFGNPSSLHSEGRKAKGAITRARQQCAAVLNCVSDQIFFCGSATEADNWAIQMQHEYLKQSGYANSTILYSQIEHKAVLNSLDEYDLPVRVDSNGRIDVNTVKILLENIMDAKFCVACQWSNNEIGVVQPIEELSELCYKHKVPLHVDAVQYARKGRIDLGRMRGITSLAISGHKIQGMKGAALLYIRDPDAPYVKPFIKGGGQEKGLRSGTENVPAIVALGFAMTKFPKDNRFDNTQVSKMHKYLQYALSDIPGARYNGDCDYQLPHYLNVSFKGIEGESLLLALDRRGICVSSGSACNSGSLEPSYVLKAIGVSDDYINGTIRISLSENNTLEECEVVAKAIKEEVAKLREVSPTWKGE